MGLKIKIRDAITSLVEQYSILERQLARQARVDLREDRRHTLAEDRQDADNDDGDQHEDQRVLDQTLSFFTSKKVAKHNRGTPQINAYQ